MTSGVPFIDLKRFNAPFYNELNSKFVQMLDKCDYILGEPVTNFENNFANYVGAKHAVSCNSGTDALFLSLKALGIGPGCEVITTSYSFAATLEVILHTGASPIFIDVDENYCIDVSKIEKTITKNTRAILPVNLFGIPVDIQKINSIAKAYNLFVVEDSAQSHGTKQNGKICGSQSDASCFSFYPTKILGGIGDGGIVTTNSDEVALKLKQIRNHGGTRRDENAFPGFCSRLDTIHAIFLNIKLRSLGKFIEQNKVLAEQYSKSLGGINNFKIPNFKEGANYYIYPIKVPDALGLQKALANKQIGSMVYYPYILPELYGNRFDPFNFPNALSLRGTLLSLPLYPGLTNDEVDQVCRVIREYPTKW